MSFIELSALIGVIFGNAGKVFRLGKSAVKLPVPLLFAVQDDTGFSKPLNLRIDDGLSRVERVEIVDAVFLEEFALPPIPA